MVDVKLGNEPSRQQIFAKELCLCLGISLKVGTGISIKVASRQDVQLLGLQGSRICLQCEISRRQDIIFSHCQQQRGRRYTMDMRCRIVFAKRFDPAVIRRQSQ